MLLGNAALGHAEIVVHPVVAEGGAEGRTSRLTGAPHPEPFRLRQVLREGLPTVRSGAIQVGAARRHVAGDLAADVANLLASGATWDGRPLLPGDVAVLVSARAHGRLVQDALAERGVAAVMPGGDVFETPAADDWLTLLEALESPHRAGLVRAAALTPFLGRTAADLDAGGEDLTARDADTLRGWALLLRHRGVAALLEAAEERGLSGRVLAGAEGERLLTDLRHLGQLLHEVSVAESLGLTALLAWFRDERRRAGTAERPRRLDSDAAAVQIVTVHGSKGLQYPVVYLPFGYDNYARPVDIALYHDEHGARTIDVSGSGAQWDARCAAHRAEEDGEELRKLYVALTRAQSQVVAWWAPTSSTPTSGLHRLLFGRTPGTREVPGTQPLKDDEYATRVLGLLQELGGPAAELAVPVEASAPLPADRHAPFEVRAFGRAVDTAWRRTSYSGLIAAADDAPHVGSEPETTGTDDEPDAPEAAAGAPGRPEAASPMADLPTGAAFGSLVHAVLEHADPFAPDLRAELLAHVTEQLRWWPVPADPEAVADGLLPLHRTPLGPLANGLTLGEIGLPDRLRELTFELPLSGGDLTGDGGTEARLRDLAPLLRAHLPAGDPLAAYAERLEQPDLGTSPCAATSPARSTWCSVCRAGGSSSSTTRRTSWAPPWPTTPTSGWRRPCCTPTTRCRPCCTGWCCTATCAGGCRATTRGPTWAACSTCSCAVWPGRTPRTPAAARRACCRGSRRPRSWWRCRTCWRAPRGRWRHDEVRHGVRYRALGRRRPARRPPCARRDGAAARLQRRGRAHRRRRPRRPPHGRRRRRGRRERAARRRARGARGAAGVGVRGPGRGGRRRRGRQHRRRRRPAPALARRGRVARPCRREPAGTALGGAGRPRAALPRPVLARGEAGARGPRGPARGPGPRGRRRPAPGQRGAAVPG
nr:hypothetical protein GCM10025730_01320 [Promicromonospora thailandica]